MHREQCDDASKEIPGRHGFDRAALSWLNRAESDVVSLVALTVYVDFAVMRLSGVTVALPASAAAPVKPLPRMSQPWAKGTICAGIAFFEFPVTHL
jgi:hypothetical protein